jgi:tryptophan synthase alpha chain
VSRIESAFSRRGHKALIPYLTAGFPSLSDSREIALWLAEAGADILELGIPFSDPLADGATIQESSYRALLNGVTPGACLQLAAGIRRASQVPLVFMTYFNPVLSYGVEKFCRDCQTNGVDGLIIPDLPVEESELVASAAFGNGLDLIHLLSPNSTDDRIRLVAEKSRGFIYLVSVTGVTGTRSELPANLGAFVQRVRGLTAKKLCVGFGISTPEQARSVSSLADGVIVGSRLIQLMQEDPGYQKLKSFFLDLRKTLGS